MQGFSAELKNNSELNINAQRLRVAYVRGMAFVRCARRSRRQQEGFLFFRPPGRFFRSREVKKLLGPLWA